MYNTIIFDLGGVLIDWNPKYLYQKIFDTEEEMNYFLDNIATPDWNEQQDGGRPLSEATSILLDQYPEEKWKDAITAFYGRWEEMLAGPIEGTIKILKDLIDTKTYSVYALTNWSAETWPKAIQLFEFLGWFDGVLVSGQEKLKKPDPAIYQLMISRFNIEMDKAIFIDDNQRNVDASNAFGLKALHFEDPDKLKNDLHTLKIL